MTIVRFFSNSKYFETLCTKVFSDLVFNFKLKKQVPIHRNTKRMITLQQSLKILNVKFSK